MAEPLSHYYMFLEDDFRYTNKPALMLRASCKCERGTVFLGTEQRAREEKGWGMEWLMLCHVTDELRKEGLCG